MAVSSRRTLLPRKSEKIISGWWLLAGFTVLLGILSFFNLGRVVLVWLTILAILTYAAVLLENRRIRKIVKQRHEDSICTFAKSFDCRAVDTKIIRATHEELQLYYSFATPSFPIRATDSFEKNLKLDDGDLEDIASEIARRTQRSMENIEQNPLHGKVRTVSDLVLLLNFQPPFQDASQRKQV